MRAVQTNHILYLLKAQEIKIKKTERKRSPSLGMKISYRVSKNICNALWMLHLLKTSMLVTRTPLTTLKSMWQTVVN